MNKFFPVFTCIGLIFLMLSSAYSASQTYTQDVTYRSCALDNALSSQVIAKEQVKQKLLGELGDTAEDWSKKYKFEFSRDSAIPVVSCLVEIETVEERQDGPDLYYKARTESDLATVLQSIGAIEKERFPTADIFANRAEAGRALKEIEQIRAELASSGTPESRQTEYDRAVNRLHAADWYEKATFSLFSKEFDQAIDRYTKAIEYNPMLVTAYQKRASLYHTHLKDTEKVIRDSMRISQIYFNRGIDSYQSKDYEACLASLDKSIKWYSRDAEAYYQRAACKIGSGSQSGVKEDFVSAAKLGHKEAQKMLTARGVEW